MNLRLPSPRLPAAAFSLLLGALNLAGSLLAAGTPAAPESVPAPPRFVVGLSPFLNPQGKEELYRQLVRLLLEGVPLNSSLWICDAYELQTITRVEVPDVRAFRSAKTRANQFKEPLRRLQEFLAKDVPPPAAAGIHLDQAVRLPQFLDLVGEHRPDNRPVVVLVFGSPLYLDAKEPHFSMADGYFPSDGHLLASREHSVFGLKERAGQLEHVTLHWGWFGDPWVSDVHRERVQRFWTLYLQGQGGRLGTFCGDLPLVFGPSALSGASATPRAAGPQLNPADSKIEMLRITRQVSQADWITREVIGPVPHGPPATTVGRLKIGIRWQGRWDIDLYARPAPSSETLGFDHTRSPEGYYFKDHRSSPEREYEFIEFESPVDLHQVEAWINFYAGDAPGGPSGEIRVEFEGRIYTGRFTLAAEHGNQGRSGRHQTAWWTTVDLTSILHLR